VTPDGERAATVRVRDGSITSVAPWDSAEASVVDVGELVILPGLVDTHVHVNEPGRTDWEGFESATRAAAAGGITTIVDMPLNSTPATTSPDALEAKRSAMAGKCSVDVGLWGGLVPGNTADLPELVAGGVLGFKCFMVPSGVEDFAEVDEATLREALPVIAELGVPLLVHAESPLPIMRASEAAEAFDPSRYETWLRSRPVEAELQAIELLIALAKQTRAHIHVVHVAAADALPLIAEARRSGVRITAETCPHYLFFSSEEIEDGALEWKCAPPIRESRHREALYEGLCEGVLDLVASDHSPAPPEIKLPPDGSYFSAWGGIASLQLSLAATWKVVRRRGGTSVDIARWMSAGPAALAGLSHRKGAIAEGRDADMVVWDPDATVVVHAAELEHRHPITPYDGLALSGEVHATYLRGNAVYERGRFTGRHGHLLTRTET
jgi:allantoinase